MNAILEYLRQGGLMMYPLILCSIITVGIVLERAITFRNAGSVDPEELLEEVKIAYGDSGDTKKTLKLLDETGHAFARLYARGIKNAGRPADSIEIALAQEAANEVPTLENNLTILRTIITVSPLLGLLGTIAGMIRSFKEVAASGLSSPQAVMSGVSESLVATATGIGVAVVSLLFYNYYSNLVKRFVEDMEYYGTELTNFLSKRVD